MSGINPIPDETTNAALKPTAKSLGNAAGTLFDAGFNLILTPLRKYNIRKEQELTDYADKINNHLSTIPEQNRDSSKMNLVLKAVDDSKYRLDEEEMREAFARLIAKGMDNRANTSFYPAYSDILSNMSVEEAAVLQKIYTNLGSSIPTDAPVATDNKTSSTRHFAPKAYIFDDAYTGNESYNVAIDLLLHSGLIKVHEDAQLTHEHYAKQYEIFEKQTKSSASILSNIQPNEHLDFNKGYITLSDFGKSFAQFIA